MAELSLKDRAVLITGPAKGMGRAITLAVAEAGGDVALLGRDLAPIEAVAREARARGVTALVFDGSDLYVGGSFTTTGGSSTVWTRARPPGRGNP